MVKCLYNRNHSVLGIKLLSERSKIEIFCISTKRRICMLSHEPRMKKTIGKSKQLICLGEGFF